MSGQKKGEDRSPRLIPRQRYPSLPLLHLTSLQSSPHLPVRSSLFGSRPAVSESCLEEEVVPENVRPAHSSVPHEDFSARNPQWLSVQQAIVSLFQQKTLSSLEMTLLCENVKELSASELGPFIYDYYKNQLMTRGLRLLRDKVEKEAGLLLRSLAVMWDVFYQEILPMLQLVLRPIQVKELSIRYVTLLGFRDTVLFKTDVEEALSMWKGEFPPAIRQMLLILQSIPDGGKPSEAGLRLERLVAGVVSPFLGYMGLYLGSTEPAVRSCHYAQHVVMATRASPERFYDPQTARSPGTPSTPDLTPPTMRLKRHQRGASISVLGLNTSSEPLEPVLESAEINTHPKSKEIISQQNSIRRYSFSGAL